MHKAGFISIIGNPNAGKSTLMNALVGERLSIVTSKAQTTRHRIHGIVNTENYQAIFSDTPGILDPKYKLHEGMMHFVNEALGDADVLVLVVDLANDDPMEKASWEKMKKITTPLIVLLNKMDAVEENVIFEKGKFFHEEFPAARIIPVSALKKKNVPMVFDEIISLLPEHPAYFPKDELTDKSERFFVGEIVREKILLQFEQEIPYSVEVVVEEFKESERLVKIRAVIYVMRESQKGIILGQGGRAIKQLGTTARFDIEKFLQKKVFIELFVKVNKDWRDNDKELKRFGYL